MLLSKTAVADYLARDFRSYTWMKSLTADEIHAELRLLKVRPVFKTEPWLHQLVCFYVALAYPHFLFLLDMGLGKTKIVLDVMTQRLREKKLERALVVVPRLINMEGWAQAAAEHSNLEPWIVDISQIEAKTDALLNPRGDFTVIDYHGLQLAMSKKRGGNRKGWQKDDRKVEKLRRVYDGVVPDEIHMVGNHQSLWFSVLRHITRDPRLCLGLTGTLFARDFEAIWSQFYLVDRGETFGENLGLFRKAFFTAAIDERSGRETLSYNKGMTRQLNKMLAHRSLRYDESEVLDLPLLVRRRAHTELSSEAHEHYMRALDGLISADGVHAEMEAQWLRMRQIASGYLMWTDGDGDHKVVFKENTRLARLEDLIDSADGKVVISHEYTQSGQLIVDMLGRRKIDYEWLYGGTRDPRACLRRFLDDPKCRVFVMNSAAGGTGVDGLQKVSRYMLIYESPSGPTIRKQLVKRIHRPGQTERTFVYDLVSTPLDSGILAALDDDADLFAQVMTGKTKGFM